MLPIEDRRRLDEPAKLTFVTKRKRLTLIASHTADERRPLLRTWNEAPNDPVWKLYRADARLERR